MNKGLVSCIIPTYKRSNSLVRAINSVLEQTYENIEVIVVDDNNPDDENSLKVQERLSTITDSRLIYIQQENHINGAVARNVGIKASKGEYIAFLDDDDEWLPKKLELQLQMLENSPEYGGISCLYTLYTNGNPIRKCPVYTGDDLHRKVLERSVAIYTSTVLLKKKSLDKSGYFDETMLRHQDLQLLLDFLDKNKMLVLPNYYVKLHTDIGGNRPNASKLIGIKEHFFSKMEYHFKKYDNKTQKRMYSAHYFEIIFSAIKEKNIKIIILYLFKIGLNPIAYKDVYKRFFKRKKNSGL